MSSDGETKIDVRGLEKLIRSLSVSPPTIRVGVLGQKTSRVPAEVEGKEATPPALTNAEIGAFHEYGEGNNPERSFLRVPIAKRLDKALEKAGAFDKDAIARVMAEGDLTAYAEKIGVVASEISVEAFATGGYGEWPPSNMDRKTNAQTLVETGQLRNSITFDVKKGA